MITKLCIICLCMTSSSMVGLIMLKRRKNRVEYFSSLVKLSDKLISEISFRKENLTVVLKEFAQDEKTELSEHVKSFCASPYEKIHIQKGILKTGERAAVEEFFFSLGATDADTQIFELRNYGQKFQEMYSSENERFKKNGNVGLKLSVLAGLAIGILIL